MYSKQLDDAIEYAKLHKSFNKMNVIEQAENVCVFGLGTYFKEAFVSQKVKEKFHVNLLSDNDESKWGNVYEGLLCVSPQELKRYKNLVVIIMIGDPISVQKQLGTMGILCMSYPDMMLDVIMELPREESWFLEESDKIKKVYTLLEDDESRRVYVNALCNRIAPPVSEYLWDELYSQESQYFNQNYFKFTEDESFVDCGAYTGDTILAFCDVVKSFHKIFAFELDKKNYLEMEKNVGKLDGNITLFNCGVWNRNEEIDYGTGTSENEPPCGVSIYKTEKSEHNIIQKAQVKKLDDVLRGERVSFIKMDVEGSEINALWGAEKIITEQKPKLAICVYHKTSDFWQIPLLLKQFNPDYRFILRHYSKIDCHDTILYAY